MSKTAIAATGVMSTGLKAAAQQMESLYFASRRTGASAGELKALGFAAEQVGISAEKARSAVEGIAAARRTNPGLNGILVGLGIDPKQTDNARVMVQLLGKLGAMPHYQGAQIAAMFGLDERTFLMLKQGLPEMQKYLALREKMFSAAGINPQDMASRSHEFMGHLRVFEGALGNLADIIAYRLMPWGERVLDWLTGVVMWLTRADKATDGWSSKILGVLSALAGGSLVKGALGTLAKLFGRSAVASVAAEGAAGAEGAAATAGGSVLAPVAAIAALGYVALNRKAAQKVADYVNNKLGIDENWLGRHATNLFGKGKDGLADLVAGFEGHAKKGYGVYRDVAGRLTAGYGHLVRPGDDLNKLRNLDEAGARSLLARDLSDAVASVARLVKVKLTNNQAAALDDFVFNVGSDKFAKSTLLRKLNAGDYAGAANEFQRWNHALVDGHMTTVAALTARRAADAKLYRTPDQTIKIDQKNEFNISSTDPKGAASEIERRQSRANADLVRNFAGAFE
jgi:GH24 family phage-related lysozyme (muramidase)